MNYATDRAAIIKLNGGPGLGTPTCQILPPGIPGYVPYCPYTINPTSGGRWIGPDLAKARALLAASHTTGAPVTVYSLNDSVSKSIGLYFESLLSQLGYRSSLKTLTTSAFVGVVGNSSFHTQAALYTWYQDYPRPSDFINVALSCSAFIPKSSANANLAEFCAPQIDAGTRHALTVEETDPGAANQLWRLQDRAVTDQAPWVPLFNPRLADFVSARVKGYQFNPVWYFLIDQAYVR
jgi:peptide/nickel transport system substrate-binding protein